MRGEYDGGRGRVNGRFDNQLRSANVKPLSFAGTLEFQKKENCIIGYKCHNTMCKTDGGTVPLFLEQWQLLQKTAAAAGLIVIATGV